MSVAGSTSEIIRHSLSWTCPSLLVYASDSSYTYDKGMLDYFEYLLLILNMIDMLAVNNLLLLHGLDGEAGLGVVLQPGVLNISKCTCNTRNIC